MKVMVVTKLITGYYPAVVKSDPIGAVKNFDLRQ